MATEDVEDRSPPVDPESSESAEDSTATAKPASKHLKARILGEWTIIIVLALAAAFLIRTYCFQTFYIPSTSMVPTLQVGDRIVVSKLSVRFGTIHRGDILVFERPPAEDCGGPQVNDLVKRVIGLPNEYLMSEGSLLYYSKTASPYHWHRIYETWSHTEPLGNPIPLGTHVPPNSYYMMGDNHYYSCDSRIWGPIPRSLVVGKVVFRIWPLSRVGFL